VINLREKDKTIICSIADDCFKIPFEIWAYGSRVNGDNHDTSDLDLVIRADNLKPINWRDLLNFIEQIRESNIPIIIQVFDWVKLPENFRNNILENHEVLYKN